MRGSLPPLFVASLWALGPALGGPSALAADAVELAAVRRLLQSEEPSERAAAVRRLAGRGDEGSVRLVVATLSDPHPYVRRAAAGVLGIAIEPAVRGRILREAPGWRDPVARAEVARALAVWADGDGRTGLLRLLSDGDERVRAEAAAALRDDLDPATEAALLRAAAGDRSALVRALALDGVAARPGPGGRRPWDGVVVARAMEKGARDPDPRVRLSALEGAVAAGGEAAAFAVDHGSTDAVWSVRLAAADLAGSVRDRRVLEPLVRALSDPRRCVAERAGASLVALTGIPFDPDPRRWRAWLDSDGRDFDPSRVVERPRPPMGPVYASTDVKFLDAPVRSDHVTFVLDASGSMNALVPGGGTRWHQVRAEIERVLGAIGTSAEGNVVLFGDEAESLFPEATRFGPSARERVRAQLAARVPRGRTALFDGIALALEDPEVDTLVVLSDGAPSAGRFFTKTDVRAEVARANRWRRARIDVVSIGADEVAKRWRSLLGDLAADHGGTLVQR